MGHKIFISYKYKDSNVKSLDKNDTTVRDYVDKLQDYIEEYSEHIYKGESDDEDLSEYSDDQIWNLLKDRIFDSTLTIVLISPNMNNGDKERNQWIPWEISYSLKEVSRKDINGNTRSSYSNALLAIILPDINGSYSYYYENKKCCSGGCNLYKTNTLFPIMKSNMFNIKKPDYYVCYDGSTIYRGESSYMKNVTWTNFIDDPEFYIEKAYSIQSAIEQYEITKELEK
ncbi:MAG: TIR domain-containing protein [Bacilli bacterium]